MIIQQGLAGKLSSHQSLASPVSFQWVEEKAKAILNQDDWSALKYHIREYARGNLTVNELGLSLLDLLDTDEKVISNKFLSSTNTGINILFTLHVFVRADQHCPSVFTNPLTVFLLFSAGTLD